ncbi:unnamed protein product [Schistosoma margrebowiei]|uniref:Uncharacterized protein n=1 Tax=Schistosoma margrebowiei TaxID=48269 RepID=A0A183LCI4_9TREM|nr:unnamed protein product [Schistosoma margrebowiei]
MKQLCDTMKKLVGKYSKPERPVKNKEDNTVIETEEQRNRWTKHFDEHLNRPVPSNLLDIKVAHRDILIDVTPPTIE